MFFLIKKIILYTMIKRLKINNIKIKPIKRKLIDERPFKGSEIFSNEFANIFMPSQKESGKSTLINQII